MSIRATNIYTGNDTLIITIIIIINDDHIFIVGEFTASCIITTR